VESQCFRAILRFICARVAVLLNRDPVVEGLGRRLSDLVRDFRVNATWVVEYNAHMRQEIGEREQRLPYLRDVRPNWLKADAIN